MKKSSINQVPPNIWNEPYITLTKEELQKRFKEYNEQYFDNVLPPCKVYLTLCKGWEAEYFISTGSIAIAKYAYWTDTSLKLYLVHEMCHHYVHKVIKPKHFVFSHGRTFNKVCKMLRKKHGLRVKASELPTVYYHKEKIPTTFWEKLWREHWGPSFN